MIKVTADIFSGRPNPEWVVSDAEAEAALRNLSQKSAAAAALHSGFQGLGNRGLIVEFLEDHTASEFGLPSTFRLAGGGSHEESHAREVAERLIATLTQQGAGEHPAVAAAVGQLPLNEDLKRFILGGLPAGAGSVATQVAEQAPTMDQAADISVTAACWIETTSFNPAFWNDPAHIGKNNCYNYATNRRTDTFAQPGRACGHMYAHINCTDVGNGAVCDGGTFLLRARLGEAPMVHGTRNRPGSWLHRLPLVSQSHARLLGPQARRHSGAQCGQFRPNRHRPTNRQPWPLHNLLPLHVRAEEDGRQVKNLGGGCCLTALCLRPQSE